MHNTQRFIRFLIGFVGLGTLEGLAMYLDAPDNVQLVLSGGAVACALIALSGLRIVDKATNLLSAWRRPK